MSENEKNEKEIPDKMVDMMGMLLSGILSSLGKDGEEMKKQWEDTEGAKLKEKLLKIQEESDKLEEIQEESEDKSENKDKPDDEKTEDKEKSEKPEEKPDESLTDFCSKAFDDCGDLPFLKNFADIFTTVINNVEKKKERSGSHGIAFANVFTPMMESAAEEDGIEFDSKTFIKTMEDMGKDFFDDKICEGDKLPL